MENENTTEGEGFLAGVQREGSEPMMPESDSEKTDEKGTDTPTESPPETKQTEETPSQEGVKDEKSNDNSNTPDDTENLPFHKHPRWQKMVEEKRAALEEKQALEARLAALENVPKSTEPEARREQKAMPKWFVDLYGDNSEAWEAYQEAQDKEVLPSVVQQAIEQIEQKQRMEVERRQQEESHYQSWVNSSIEAVEESFDVDLTNDKNLRNEFIDFTIKYKPTNENGEIDLKLSYELFAEKHQKENKQKSEARKTIASKTGTDTKSEQKPRDFFTPSDLRHKDFLTLARKR